MISLAFLMLLAPQPKTAPSVTAFFCGCEPCHEAGKLWGRIQRSSELDSAGKGKITLVFQGSVEAAKGFIDEVGLEPGKTFIVPDPQAVKARANHALPCPRMFVRDSNGRLRYTNSRKDDAPQTGSASLMVARAVEALRSLSKV